MTKKELSKYMSKLARKSVRARKKNPKKFQDHMELIASKGGKNRWKKGMGQVWQLDPFDLRGEPSAHLTTPPFSYSNIFVIFQGKNRSKLSTSQAEPFG